MIGWFKRTFPFEYQVIYGQNGDPYLERTTLIHTKRGELYLHRFHRGDEDYEPHDHPWDFWTIPFTSYLEAVPIAGGEHMGLLRTVKAFRLHRRSAFHLHRVLWRADMVNKPWRTLVWAGPRKREWGFLVGPEPYNLTGPGSPKYWLDWFAFLEARKLGFNKDQLLFLARQIGRHL